MIIYFCDRELNILGHASTELPAGNRISQDKTTEDVETGVNTFECVLTWDDNSRSELEQGIVSGNYILKKGSCGDYDSLYQIVETESDTKAQEISLYAEDAGLDLLNTLCGAETLTNKTIVEMIAYFLPEGWSVEAEDAPTTTKTNTWDGTSTCTERLRSIVGLWDCEIYYSFRIVALQVVDRVVNVVQKRGLQVAIPQLRLNYDIDRIRTKTSITDLCTALAVKGGGDPAINLKNYDCTYTDPTTGDVYEVDKPTGQMRNITAMQRWSSAIDADGLLVGEYSYDTEDKAMLAGQARAELQRLCHPAVNYEVDFSKLPEDAQIGDRINIIDEHGKLYLEARLLQIETSAANDTQKAVIGEYVLRASGISDKVAAMASEVASLANRNAYGIEITSSDGTLFQTSYVATTLTAHVYSYGYELDEDQIAEVGTIKWYNGNTLLGTGKTYTITSASNILAIQVTARLEG